MSPTIRKIFLTAGHRGGTSGANYNGINEAEETIWLRNKIVSILRKKEIDVSIDDDTANLSTVIETINSSCSVVDICVDLHFNAFSDNSVNGTEVLKPNNYSITELEVAEDLLYATCMILGTQNRGIKKEGTGQYKRLAMLSDVKCNSVLLEICFISNKEDVKKYQEHKEELAIMLAEQLAQHAYC